MSNVCQVSGCGHKVIHPYRDSLYLRYKWLDDYYPDGYYPLWVCSKHVGEKWSPLGSLKHIPRADIEAPLDRWIRCWDGRLENEYKQ